MNPYISMIIPAYNEEIKIKDTLESIKGIKEINEIIVVDDGSTDKTTKIASEVNSEKIVVLKLDKNRGKGYALNYGLKIAMKNAEIKIVTPALAIIDTTAGLRDASVP